mgnify:CR=1 FL=1
MKMVSRPSSPSLDPEVCRRVCQAQTGCIYRLVFPNGKSYIGKTVNDPKIRWRQHRSGSTRCPLVAKAIRKYGWVNVKTEVMLKVCSSQLNEYEIKFIEMYDTMVPRGYNLARGGGIDPNYRWRDATPEYKADFGEKMKRAHAKPKHKAAHKKAVAEHKASMSKEARVAAVNKSWEVRRANPRQRDVNKPHTMCAAHVAKREAALAKLPPEQREKKRAQLEADSIKNRQKYRERNWV